MRKEQKLAGIMAVAAAFSASPVAQAVTVQQAVRQALDTNPEVQAAIANRYATTEAWRVARSGFYPSVTLYGTYGRENTSNPYTRAVTGSSDYRDLTRKEASIVFTQPLFDGFATSNERQRATADVDAASYSVQDTAQQIALDALNAYLDVVRERRLTSLAQEFLATHQRIYDQIRKRAEAGIGSQADVEQAKGRLALAKSNAIAANANLTDALSRYESVVGTEPDANMTLPALGADALPATLTVALDEATQQNPGIKQAQARVIASQAARQAERAGYWPHLSLVASHNWGEDLYGRKGVEQGYRALLQMRYNLLSGGGNTAAEKSAAYRENQAKDSLNSERRSVSAEIKRQWNEYVSASEKKDLFRQQQSAAEQTRNAYEKQFRIGQRTLLDLLDSENELFKATSDYVTTQHTQVKAAYALLADSGLLLAYLGEPMPAAAHCVEGRSCLGSAYTSPAQTALFAQAVERDKKAMQHRVGSFVFVPQLSVSATQDDNIYVTPDQEKSDSLVQLRTSFALQSDWSKHKLEAEVGGLATRYAEYNTENSSDYWLKLNGQYDISERSNIFGGASSSYKHEDRASPDYIYTVVPDAPIHYRERRTHVGVEQGVGPVSIKLAAAYTAMDFENSTSTLGARINNDDRDRELVGYGVRLTLMPGSSYQPFLQYTSDNRDYRDKVDDYGYKRSSSGYRAHLGLRVATTPLSAEAYIGKLNQSFDDARFSDVEKPDYGVKVKWKPLRKLALEAMEKTSLEETTLDASSSYYYTSSAASLSYDITDKWTVKLTGLQSKSEFQDVSRVDKGRLTATGLTYALDDKVSLSGEVQKEKRTSDEPLDEFTANRFIFRVSAEL